MVLEVQHDVPSKIVPESIEVTIQWEKEFDETKAKQVESIELKTITKQMESMYKKCMSKP
jgi:hypothetical protein